MGNAGLAVHESIDARGQTSSSLVELVAMTAQASSYDVTRGASGTLHLARTFRPTWAVVLTVCTFPVGLLFLMVRRTEACTVTVVDGPRGAVVTVAGTMRAPALAAVRSAVASASAASGSPRSAGAVVATAAGTAAPRAHEDALVRAAPFTVASGAPVQETVARQPMSPAGEAVARPAPTPTPPGLLVGDRFITLERTVVIGRDPAATGVHIGAALCAVSDRSVSKTHAAFGSEGAQVWVEDLHSTNGTHVEDALGAVSSVVPGVRMLLDGGTTVRLGDLEVTVALRG